MIPLEGCWDHNDTLPLYENPVSLYAQLQHCSANHLSTWDRVGEIDPVHTVTKDESRGEPSGSSGQILLLLAKKLDIMIMEKSRLCCAILLLIKATSARGPKFRWSPHHSH